MNINFELYKIFYQTAKCSSFSTAAEKLFITQSAVSQAIKNLELQTGSKLFYRKTRNIKLTPEGELLFKHIEQAYNYIKTAETKLLEIQNMSSGEIRIGAGDTICKHYLVPFIEKFYSRYPNIKIHIVNRTSSQILDILRNGLIDLGIVTLPVENKDFSIEDFITVEDVFVASSKYVELRGKTISIKDLSSFPVLMLPKNSATRHNIDSYLESNGLSLTPEIELESMDLLLEFAKIGIGIAHVLKESAASAIEKGELFELKVREALPRRKLGIALMSQVPLSKTAIEFIHLLKNKG